MFSQPLYKDLLFRIDDCETPLALIGPSLFRRVENNNLFLYERKDYFRNIFPGLAQQ